MKLLQIFFYDCEIMSSKPLTIHFFHFQYFFIDGFSIIQLIFTDSEGLHFF